MTPIVLYPPDKEKYKRLYSQYAPTFAKVEGVDFSKRKALVSKPVAQPRISRVVKNGVRFYEVEGDDSLYSSITSVLSLSSDHTWLEDWRKRIGEENAERTSRVSSNRGTQLHKICENYLFGLCPLEGDEMFMPDSIYMFKSIVPALNTIEGVIDLEAMMHSKSLKIAGTTDCIGIIDGNYCIIDFKNSKREKTLEQIQDYILQEAAYALMAKESRNIDITNLVTMIAVEETKTVQVFNIKLERKHIEDLKQRVKVFNDYVGCNYE